MQVLRGALSSQHVGAVVRLSSGIGLAQLIALVTGPVVTRLYNPSDYGSMAIYVSLVAIISSMATGRYEAAISLPEETPQGEREAIQLVRLSVRLAAIVAVSVGVVVGIVEAIGAGSVLGDLGLWAFAIPVGVFATALQQTLYCYATRRRQYALTAKVAPLQRIGTAAIQIGLGLAGAGRSGLMMAAMASPLVGLGMLGRAYSVGRRAVYPEEVTPEPGEIRRLARKYSDFPRLNVPFALMNALSWNIQVIVIAWFYSSSDVGQYSLAFMVVSLPASLLVAAVSQVYLRESAGKADDPAANLGFTKKMLKGLALASILPFPIIMLFGPQLFAVVFGDDWQLAGQIAVAVSPLLWCRFLGTTVSSSFTVYRRQGVLLVWQIVSLTVTLACYVLGGSAGLSIVSVTWLASLLVGPLYLLLIPMGLRVIATAGRKSVDPTASHQSSGRQTTDVDPEV